MVQQTENIMEPENMADENLWGVLGDAMEWSFQTEVPVFLLILLLVERVAREWIAMRGKRRVSDHDHK